MKRVLLLATTTGYQTRAFGEAAARLEVELVFATDRCHLIEDPWQDQAIPIRFYDEDASVAAILESAAIRRLDGLLVVGDRPTVIAARVAERLGLPWHSAEAAAAAGHKQLTRERLRQAGLPVPWFTPAAIADGLSAIDRRSLSYPCVLKPVALSGSRGVMRADDEQGLARAFRRLQSLMRQPDVRAERNDAHAAALVEGFIPGREFALEGLLQHGRLQTLAIFDKPDPLDGPFFEETIYVTPSSASADTQRAIVDGVARAADALGLQHGPVHAECRVNPDGVFVLEVAARPIGGLCARALRFETTASSQSVISPQHSAISPQHST
ncbi:MAG: ATP-grasp domain-containing protein, partial [Vicinamibacterales bacterium]